MPRGYKISRYQLESVYSTAAETGAFCARTNVDPQKSERYSRAD